MNEFLDNPTVLRIAKAFSSPTSLRTLGGISRHTGLSVAEVKSCVEQHEGVFIKSPLTPAGRPLYRVHKDLYSQAHPEDGQFVAASEGGVAQE